MINTELFKEVSPLSAKDCFILIERQKSNFNFPIHIHPDGAAAIKGLSLIHI